MLTWPYSTFIRLQVPFFLLHSSLNKRRSCFRWALQASSYDVSVAPISSSKCWCEIFLEACFSFQVNNISSIGIINYSLYACCRTCTGINDIAKLLIQLHRWSPGLSTKPQPVSISRKLLTKINWIHFYYILIHYICKHLILNWQCSLQMQDEGPSGSCEENDQAQELSFCHAEFQANMHCLL